MVTSIIISFIVLFTGIGIFTTLYAILDLLEKDLFSGFKTNIFKIDDCGEDSDYRYILYQKTKFGTWSKIDKYIYKDTAKREMYQRIKKNSKPISEIYNLNPIEDTTRLIENKNE